MIGEMGFFVYKKTKLTFRVVLYSLFKLNNDMKIIEAVQNFELLNE